MANFAIVADASAEAVQFDAHPESGSPAIPRMAWPATGGNGGTEINEDVYIRLVPPRGSLAAGGATVGQLFPVGNR